MIGRTAVALAGGFATAALACGVCVDDKVAAAYDHAVVTAAAGRRQVVVFVEVSGTADAATLMAKAKRVASRVRGVDRASLRSASAPAVLSFALDPRVRTPEAALAAVQEAAGAGVRLTLLRVLP